MQLDLTKKVSRKKHKQNREERNLVEQMEKLCHENILLFQESFLTDKHLILIEQRCELGDMNDLLHNWRNANKEDTFFQAAEGREYIPEYLIVAVLIQVGRALSVPHEDKLVHGDVCATNIFIQSDG